jgi:hypothetical protein
VVAPSSARSGFGDADLGRAAVQPDLFGQRLGVDVPGAGGDRLVHEPLHLDDRVGTLSRPAPFGVGVRGVGDAGQLAQRVRAAQPNRSGPRSFVVSLNNSHSSILRIVAASMLSVGLAASGGGVAQFTSMRSRRVLLPGEQ